MHLWDHVEPKWAAPAPSAVAPSPRPPQDLSGYQETRMGAIKDFELDGWQAAAWSYGGFAGATQVFVRALLRAAGAGPGIRLLDVACGTGLAASAAAALGARIAGVDFSPAMVVMARSLHPALELQTADAEELPFASGCHDAVIANFGIHHVERPERAMAEARPVLSPGRT